MQRIALMLLFASSFCQAMEIYQWRDADGRLHFGDVPPPEAAAEPRAVGALNVVDPWRAQSVRRPEVRPRQRPSRAVAVEARNAREEKRAEKCHQARQQLDEVRAKRRAGYKAAEGRALKQRANRYQEDVRFYCGSWR